MRTAQWGALFGLLLLLLCPPVANAYAPGTLYSWDASTPNYNPAAVIYDGAISTSSLVYGNFLGVSAGQPNALTFGDSGASVGWDDSWVGGVGDPNTNGDLLDGLWAQIYGDGGWWDLGSAYQQVAVFSSQDHGPYVGEGVEYRVFGTNTLWDDGSLSGQAALSAIYLDGWRTHNPAEDANGNGWLSDDVGGVFQFNQSYRYVKLVAWGGGSFEEPEIDNVTGVVPEPGALLLLGAGLIGLAGARWRKGRR